MYVINGRLASDNPIIQDIQKYSDMWNALLSTLEKVDLSYFESRSLVGDIALTGRDYTKMLLSAFCAFRSKLMQKLFKTSDVLPDFYEDVLGCLDNLYFPNDVDDVDSQFEYLYSNIYSCITGNPLSDLFVRPVAKTPHVRPVNFSVGALYDYVEGFQGDFNDLFDDEELHGSVRTTSRSILASLIDEDNDDSLDSILDSVESFLCGYPVNTADCLVHGVFVTLPEGGCEEIKEWVRDNLVQCRYSLSHLYVETKEGLYILQVSGFVASSSYYLYGGFRGLDYTHPIFFLTPSPFLNYAYELFGKEKGWW